MNFADCFSTIVRVMPELLLFYLPIAAFLLLFIRPVHCGTSKNEGGKNAMEAIYDINLQMDEIEANEMIDIDERFEYVVPDDIPEGAAAGLIKKQQQRLWKNGIVYFRFSNAYCEFLCCLP